MGQTIQIKHLVAGREVTDRGEFRGIKQGFGAVLHARSHLSIAIREDDFISAFLTDATS